VDARGDLATHDGKGTSPSASAVELPARGAAKSSFRLPPLSLVALRGRNVGRKESIDTVERATERLSQANFAVPQFGSR
jgi:hypothetical protein